MHRLSLLQVVTCIPSAYEEFSCNFSLVVSFCRSPRATGMCASFSSGLFLSFCAMHWWRWLWWSLLHLGCTEPQCMPFHLHQHWWPLSHLFQLQLMVQGNKKEHPVVNIHWIQVTLFSWKNIIMVIPFNSFYWLYNKTAYQCRLHLWWSIIPKFHFFSGKGFFTSYRHFLWHVNEADPRKK